MSKPRMALHWKILIGMVAGIVFGLVASAMGWQQFSADWIKPFGVIFINVLKLIAIPLIIKAINAWALGAQSVNPDATVEVVWLNSWFDPAAERQAAESLIADGAQVVGHSQDTPSACQAAEAAGVFCTGNTIDQGDFTPKAWLTGDVINWGQYAVQRVGEAMAGTWETGSFYGTMSSGVMEIAPFGEAVDAGTRALIETTRDGIADGSFSYFVGPISDQSGELVVPEGEKMSFEEIVTMDWFVEGILGSSSG